MNFVIVPEEVSRLLGGHNVGLLPPPSGGGQLQHQYFPQDSIVLTVKALARAMEVRDADRARDVDETNAEKLISVFSERAEDYKISESFPTRRFKLLARELNTKDGRVKVEWIWNRDARDRMRMRLRGSRKQVAARAARKANLADTRVFNMPIMNSLGEIVGWKAQRSEAPVGSFNQGVRTTNFEMGEKFSGPPPKKVKALKKEREVKVVRVEVVASAKVLDAYEEAQRQLADLERRVRALLLGK